MNPITGNIGTTNPSAPAEAGHASNLDLGSLHCDACLLHDLAELLFNEATALRHREFRGGRVEGFDAFERLETIALTVLRLVEAVRDPIADVVDRQIAGKA